MYSIWHNVWSIIGGLEVIRTDFIALYCIVPNRNLQGLPKHLNGHPRVSEQKLLPQNMVWRTREASGLPHSERTTDSTPPRLPSTNSTPPDPTPQGGGRGIPTHQTPYHRAKREGIPTHKTPHHTGRRREGDSHPPDPTPQGGKEGRGFPINPTTTHGGGFPDHFFFGGGGRIGLRHTAYAPVPRTPTQGLLAADWLYLSHC